MTHAPETIRSFFVTGLRDIHAVEHQALALIDRQLDRIVSYPELADRLRAHKEETNAQIKRIEDILSTLNESHSGLKDLALTLTGNMAALAHTIAGDEILKNSFASFAFENFEAAGYLSLITVADMGSFGSAASLLGQSLNEELEMASWIKERIPELTRTFLHKSSTDQKASR